MKTFDFITYFRTGFICIDFVPSFSPDIILFAYMGRHSTYILRRFGEFYLQGGCTFYDIVQVRASFSVSFCT